MTNSLHQPNYTFIDSKWWRSWTRLFGGLTLLAILSLAACEAPRTAGPVPGSAKERAIVLTAGDVVTISFSGTPELNQTEKIRSDGMINLPQVGEVKAAGKSPEALQSELATRFAPKLRNASVLVGLQRSNAAVYVSGAVNRPGKVSMERPLTAFEAIMESGGFTPGLANPKKVILVRQTNGQQHTQILDLSPALRNEAGEAFYLQPYDSLIVKEKMF